MATTSRTSLSREPRSVREGRVLRLPVPDSDAALVAAVRAGRADARDEIVRRCVPDVERILYRVLGPDPEMEDVAHDVFVAALAALGQLRNPEALRSWLVGIAIRKARKLIARRRRWRFLRSVPPGELPEQEAPALSAEVRDALRSTYRILAELPTDDRIAFALRQVEGMELTAVAEATEVSLATAKRRIARGQQRFLELARHHDALASWLREDGRAPKGES
jgi:RNA polymerase sigma-70 factor (ECF subfamily)